MFNRKEKFDKSEQKKGLSFIENWRINFLFFIVLGIISTIFYRLYNLQVIGHEEMYAKAQKQYEFFEKLKPKRGQIYIKDGKTNYIPVATNEERDKVVIIPKYINDKETAISKLTEILEINKDEIREKVMKEDDPYEIIARKISKNQSEKIKNAEIHGVELVPEDWRNYPEGHLASQIIGFVGYREDKRVGQYGIEDYFNSILEGESGFVKAEKDTLGRWISINQRILERPRNGADVYLTIDQTIQFYTEKLLEESINKYGATSGNIIVMDPYTGKIIAMANFPSYNNNEFNKVEDPSVFKNSCISEQFEPGSIFKTLTASIPLNLNLVNPQSTYQDKGYYKVAGYTIKNSDEKAYGNVSLTRFLELSLNTGAIWSMQLAGQEQYLKYLKDYGLGKKTKIELAGEIPGDIQNLEYNREINFVTASFGQGVSVTPIQLITAFSAIINGGDLVKPQIVEKIVYNEEDTEIIEKKVIRNVIDSKTSSQMKAMLISVVKNGWGEKAGVPGYLIGGKTGTAQIPSSDGSGYSEETIHSFIGFAPGDKPKFVTLVKLNKVSEVNFSSDSAAVVTGKLNKFLLDNFYIFPTEETTEEEIEEFNNLMELKDEDIKRINEESEKTKEGEEGFSPINE